MPPHIAEAAKELPVRTSDADKTQGIAFNDATGERLTEDPIESGKRGPGRGGPGLSNEYQKGFGASDHVEGHTAALMRTPDGPTDVSLVVNNEPCQGAYGCDTQLADWLPQGSTMTVYISDQNGVRMHDRYPGTGKGLART